MKRYVLYVLDLASSLYDEFFGDVKISEETEIKVYKTFPRFLKAVQTECTESPTIILVLPRGSFDSGKIRQLRLVHLDSPMYIITGECNEKSYLTFLSIGVNAILTPPFEKVDVQSVLNGHDSRVISFPRSNELIKEGQIRLDFLVPSKLSRILGVNRMVSFLAAEFGFPPEECRVNLPMVLDEVLSNAIEHGNKGNENLKIHVRIYISSRRIVIQVEDQGDGFIPENISDPTDQENLYKGSGRGIFLMKELMDKVSFRDGGRLVEVEKLNPLQK